MKTFLLKTALYLIFFLSVSISCKAENKFIENLHYKRVSMLTTIEKNSTEKIEIIEFFLYSCPHCYELEPKLEKWIEKNKDKVTFKRVPAVISASWVALAKAYYIAEKRNILPQTHDALFKSIHDEKKIYFNEYALAKFYENYGLSQDDFMLDFNSKEITEKASEARKLTVKYAFRGVPAVVINKEFKTAPFYTKDQEQMLEVLDELLTSIIEAKN